MLTENTENKLREMHLSIMASAFKEQLTDSQFQSMSFEDRIGLCETCCFRGRWKGPQAVPADGCILRQDNCEPLPYLERRQGRSCRCPLHQAA